VRLAPPDLADAMAPVLQAERAPAPRHSAPRPSARPDDRCETGRRRAAQAGRRGSASPRGAGRGACGAAWSRCVTRPHSRGAVRLALTSGARRRRAPRSRARPRTHKRKHARTHACMRTAARARRHVPHRPVVVRLRLGPSAAQRSGAAQHRRGGVPPRAAAASGCGGVLPLPPRARAALPSDPHERRRRPRRRHRTQSKAVVGVFVHSACAGDERRG
jgi:hypothetical protein